MENLTTFNNYKHFEDSGHSWLRVPKTEVIALGLTPTGFSPKDKDFFYLEEDYDMQLFFQAKGIKGEAVREFFRNIPSQWDNTSPVRALR